MNPLEDALDLIGLDKKEFNSFAVLDLETANLPAHNYNKVGITELSIYGISVDELKNRKYVNGKVPDLPRVLHKLTLMFHPRMMIVPDAEKITGLNNYMLEYESTFDENAASTVVNFLSHLRQPVCLVAHNGFFFDFPIVKHVLDKVQLTIPESIYCVDSLRAFHDIDQERISLSNVITSEEDININKMVDNYDLEKVLEAEKNFDARALNETTPKRPTQSVAAAASKRKYNNDDDCKAIDSCKTFKSKRSLNFGESTMANTVMNLSYQLPAGRKWFPPKNLYKLGNIYKRIFKEDPKHAHRAEADVLVLTQLLLYYGEDFINYAERHARKFTSIPRVGKGN